MNSHYLSTQYINGETILVGLLGSDIRLSRSLPIHNSAFHELNLNWAYLPLNVNPKSDSIQDAVSGLRALGFSGANITMPFKESVIPFLDELTPAAQRIGAVNTILVTADKRLVGGNSDTGGFLEDLKSKGIKWNNRPVLLLGAGGAARAVAYGLAETGCGPITIYNRTTERATKLATELQKFFPEQPIQVLDRLHSGNIASNALIINGTPVGMKGIYAPSGEDYLWPSSLSFQKSQVVVDLIYAPLETSLLKKAGFDGATTINGLGMLVQQAALSFSWWTGQDAPIDTMTAAAKGIAL